MPILHCPRNNSNHRNRRSGQALVEFAFVSIVFVMLSSLALAFGIMMIQGMVTANASASAGRILHNHRRLSPEAFSTMRSIVGAPNAYNIANPTAIEIMDLITADFVGSTDPDEREFTSAGRFGPPLYDERALVLTREQYRQSAALPELNRLLLPNYVYDADRDRFRYPGAVVQRDSDNALTVLVPLTEGVVDGCFNTGDCSEYDPDALTYWLRPLRICKLDNTCDITTNSMPAELAADGSFRVDIILPAQAGSLVAFQPVRDGGGTVVLDGAGNEVRTRVVADDSSLANLSILPAGYSLAPVTPNPDFASLSTRGDYGLGELTVIDMSQEPFEPIQVRPYRRVIEHSSAFRLGQRFEAMYRLDGLNSLSNLTVPSNRTIPIDFRNQLNDPADVFAYGPAEDFSGVSITPLIATIPVSGKWRVSAGVWFLPTPATGNLQLRLYRRVAPAAFEHIHTLAQTTFPPSNPPASYAFGVSNATTLDFNQGDEIQICVFQDSGDSLTFNDSESNWLSLEASFLSN